MFISSLLLQKKKHRVNPPWKLARSKQSAATANRALYSRRAYRLAWSCTLATTIFAFLIPISKVNARNTSAPPDPADIILIHGKIYTDPLEGRHWSQALSIRNGNILSIGSDRGIEKDKGPSTKVIDLKGRVVLPGFNDSLVHVIQGGLDSMRVDLSKASSIQQIQNRIKKYAKAHPGKGWIFGQGWDQSLLPGKKAPTLHDIDAVESDRPVMLWSADMHKLLLNSKGLAYLDITRKTPNPKRRGRKIGTIQKDASGYPTGILIDQAAFEAAAKIDNPGFDEIRKAFLVAQDEALKYGVTSIQGGPIRGEDEVNAVEDIYKKGQLKIRYSMWGDLEKPNEFLALRKEHKNLPQNWLTLEGLKGFVDGVLSSRTAALIKPYSDDPKTRGQPLYTQKKLNQLVLTANRDGLPVALHAIGDRAAAMAVTALANSSQLLFNSRIRNRIEHLEVVPPYIFQKFTQAGIVASVQPAQMLYDNESQNYTPARLGPKRVKQAFAWRSFLHANVHMAFGSGWPVMPLNPMIGLFAAVYRRNFNDRPRRGWQPQQKISMEQAIDAYTLGGAYATREDHVKGTLRDGKFADLVILDEDPFHTYGRNLLKIHVITTIVNGKIVYDASGPTIGPMPH